MRDPEKISSWIFRIAYHLCQDHFRTLKKSSTQEEIHDGLVNLEETPIQKKLEQEEMSRCVQDKLNLLPETQRSIIIFADIMEFSHQEIADILGLTVENVKVRLHRARKKLKAILEKECTFEVDERSVLVCEPVEIKKREVISMFAYGGFWNGFHWWWIIPVAMMILCFFMMRRHRGRHDGLVQIPS